MNYYLYKIKFETPLHIGESESARSLETCVMSFCADTLFSALCHTALIADGTDGIEKLYRQAKENNLRLSDSMPYKGNVLYIPKPYAAAKVRREVKREDRKAMKKLTHIPIEKLPEFCSSLNGGTVFLASNVDTNFGINSLTEKVSIEFSKETEPYTVGQFSFHEDCGLYVIIGYEKEEDLEYIKRLNRLMGLGGIGGKISSGYGKFQVEDEIYLDSPKDEQAKLLHKMLMNKTANRYISLTASLPQDHELHKAVEGSSYSLIRRGGFVQSESYHTSPLKKPTQYFFCAGSVFQTAFEGDVFNISAKGKHPVYRYAKPIFLGVKL